MSNLSKWLPPESEETLEVYRHCDEVQNVSSAITKLLMDAETKWHPRMPHSKISGRDYVVTINNIQTLDQIIEYLSKLVKAYYKLTPKLARRSHDKNESAINIGKSNITMEALCRRRYILVYAINKLILTILRCCLHREDTRKLIELCFSLTTVHNELLGLSGKVFVSQYNICSNACPTIVVQPKKLSMTKIVQVLALSRAEVNCQSLIDNLVQKYKNDSYSDEDSSNASSMEIFHTLTKHMEPPDTIPAAAIPIIKVENKKVEFIEKREKFRQSKSMVEIKNAHSRRGSKKYEVAPVRTSDSEVPYTYLLDQDDSNINGYSDNEDNLYDMLHSEELYIEILLDTAVRMAPNLLGPDGVKKLRTGELRVSKKAALRVMEYYQNVLWGEVGGYLEHVVLWWGDDPLASRSPHTSQNLREWLMTFNSKNTPTLILAALRSLADALGCHVTSTSWDKLFGATLVTNLKARSLEGMPELSLTVTECSETGASFALVLQELVGLSNQCEVTADYILGAPLHQLPLVEQIPILHRLDHSIHTCRLWCLAETRRFANLWDMDAFFRIAHNDIKTCLEQLACLRFADHSVALETGSVGVHEHVCGKMREKLVSEIKINIQKLKDSLEECMEVLAAVCATTSLARLSMSFPDSREWRAVRHPPQPDHSLYVANFLDKILLPVVKATDDRLVINAMLKIMCESWLHHIYVSRVKFSNDAAVQLLADFDAVRTWINQCPALSANARKQLLANEVLRRCEGVGRLLLHSPGDPISMQASTSQSLSHVRKHDADGGEEGAGQLMPAEMYVPNQQQWLTLRARRSNFALPLCCGRV